MENIVNYDEVKNTLHHLNTDDTIASAHGILCGFACVKPNLSLDEWLNEVLVSIDFDNLNEKSAHEKLAQVYNNTLLQLGDETLNFQLLIADEDCALKEQADTLIQWCQGFLVGLGLQKCQIKKVLTLNTPKSVINCLLITLFFGHCLFLTLSVCLM
jgi:uncharacterized protein YgfB (UPF0149 family)